MCQRDFAMALSVALGLGTLAVTPVNARAQGSAAATERTAQFPQADGATPAPAGDPAGDAAPAHGATSTNGDAADVQHRYSVTWSFFSGILGVFQINGEYRVKDDLGAAMGLGIGKVENSRNDKFTAERVHAQVRYYPLGSFVHGLQIAGGFEYFLVNRSESDPLAYAEEGLIVSPYIGYKIAANCGFTFETQFGYGYSLYNATTTARQEKPGSWHVTMDLGVGWSF